MTKRLRSIYHGYVQIAEIDATDEAAPFVTKTYRWDPSEPVATRPLVMSLWTREGAVRETLYYAHDLRKNVVSLFDGKGLRRASCEYDPFGNITSMEGDMAKENPYRFSSEYHDEDLGLVYYNYRHYNPTDGRWTSRDPIAEQGGYNLYGFVGNSVIFVVDRLGLADIEINVKRTYYQHETLSDWSAKASDSTIAAECGHVLGKGIELKKGIYSLKPDKGYTIRKKQYPVPEGSYSGSFGKTDYTINALFYDKGKVPEWYTQAQAELMKAMVQQAKQTQRYSVGFSGIQWHVGLQINWTRGCMLVGSQYEQKMVSLDIYQEEGSALLHTFSIHDTYMKAEELSLFICCVKAKLKRTPSIRYTYTS